jgi:hypothetical protein
VHFESSRSGRAGALRAVEVVSNVSISGLFLFAELSKRFLESERKLQLVNNIFITIIISCYYVLNTML